MDAFTHVMKCLVSELSWVQSGCTLLTVTIAFDLCKSGTSHTVHSVHSSHAPSETGAVIIIVVHSS